MSARVGVLRATMAALCVSLAACSSSVLLPGARLPEVLALVRAHRIGSVADMRGLEDWEEQLEDGRATVHARSSGTFDVLIPILTLGLWIVCDTHHTISIASRPDGVVLSVRGLGHHQLLFLLPLVYRLGSWERDYLQFIAAQLTRSDVTEDEEPGDPR